MKFSTSLHIAFLIVLLTVFSGAGHCFAKTASFQCENCTVAESIASSAMQHSGNSMHEQEAEKQQQPSCDHSTLCHSDIVQQTFLTAPPSPPVVDFAPSLHSEQPSAPLNNFISSNFNRPPPPTANQIPIFTLHCSFLI